MSHRSGFPQNGFATASSWCYENTHRTGSTEMIANSSDYAHCANVLRQSPLFAELSDTELHDMMTLFRYERRRKRDTSLAPAETQQQLYVIIDGRAKASVYHPQTGREKVLFLLGPGDVFNVVSLLDGEEHPAIAIALDDMEVLSTSVEQAREWVERHPDFNRTFLPYLGKQMRMLAEQVEDVALYDTEARLARLILRHLDPNASVTSVRLINDLSHEALASLIGSVRVVVTRQLQEWKAAHILSREHGRWSIHDLQALLEKAEYRLRSASADR